MFVPLNWASLTGIFLIIYGIYLITRIFKILRLSKKIPINIIMGVVGLSWSGLVMFFQGWRFDPSYQLFYLSSALGNFICLQEMVGYYLQKRKKSGITIFDKFKYFKYISILVAIYIFPYSQNRLFPFDDWATLKNSYLLPSVLLIYFVLWTFIRIELQGIEINIKIKGKDPK